jgi:hypothetical protein
MHGKAVFLSIINTNNSEIELFNMSCSPNYAGSNGQSRRVHLYFSFTLHDQKSGKKELIDLVSIKSFHHACSLPSIASYHSTFFAITLSENALGSNFLHTNERRSGITGFVESMIRI